MNCSVYLIKSKIDGSYYTGISHNPIRRLAEHNNGKLKTISRKKPYALVYIKKYDNYPLARKHEAWLKKKNIIYKDKLAQLAPPEIGGVK